MRAFLAIWKAKDQVIYYLIGKIQIFYIFKHTTQCTQVQCYKLRRWDLYTCNPCVSSKVVFKGLNRSIRAMVSKWGIVRLHSDKEIPSNHDISSLENHAITIDH